MFARVRVYLRVQACGCVCVCVCLCVCLAGSSERRQQASRSRVHPFISSLGFPRSRVKNVKQRKEHASDLPVNDVIKVSDGEPQKASKQLFSFTRTITLINNLLNISAS